MVVAAEGARVDTALAVRLSVPSGSLMVSVEGPAAGTAPVEAAAMIAAAAVEDVAVIEGSAVRKITFVVIDCVVVVPVESPPMMPAPTITAEEADSETNTEREIGAAVPH